MLKPGQQKGWLYTVNHGSLLLRIEAGRSKADVVGYAPVHRSPIDFGFFQGDVGCRQPPGRNAGGDILQQDRLAVGGSLAVGGPGADMIRGMGLQAADDLTVRAESGAPAGHAQVVFCRRIGIRPPDDAMAGDHASPIRRNICQHPGGGLMDVCLYSLYMHFGRAGFPDEKSRLQKVFQGSPASVAGLNEEVHIAGIQGCGDLCGVPAVFLLQGQCDPFGGVLRAEVQADCLSAWLMPGAMEVEREDGRFALPHLIRVVPVPVLKVQGGKRGKNPGVLPGVKSQADPGLTLPAGNQKTVQAELH